MINFLLFLSVNLVYSRREINAIARATTLGVCLVVSVCKI